MSPQANSLALLIFAFFAFLTHTHTHFSQCRFSPTETLTNWIRSMQMDSLSLSHALTHSACFFLVGLLHFIPLPFMSIQSLQTKGLEKHREGYQTQKQGDRKGARGRKSGKMSKGERHIDGHRESERERGSKCLRPALTSAKITFLFCTAAPNTYSAHQVLLACRA